MIHQKKIAEYLTNGKYLLLNDLTSSITGLMPNELVGLTVEDISNHMGFLKKSKSQFVKTVKEIEERVNVNKSPILLREIFVTYEGSLRLQNMLKIPLIGHDNKTIAIFSCDEDLTPRVNLFDLFQLYKKFYLPGQAIKQFLGYFKVGIYFSEMPTYTETLVIISMSFDNRHKNIAKQLNKTSRTVDGHIASLRLKLKPKVNLTQVIEGIRNANRNTCSLEDWLTS